MVFTGVAGSPSNHCGNLGGKTPSTNVEKTPRISEKPYITIESSSGKFFLQVPPLKIESRGANFSTAGVKSIDFSQVYVTRTTDTAAVMNKKLSQGLHLLLTPGIYKIDEPLRVNHANQIVLGLGLATLVASNGNGIISVGNVPGVRIGGIILQAGPMKGGSASPYLLQWGRAVGKQYPGDPKNPGSLHDVFCRVGGPDGTSANPVAAKVMVHIRSGNVIGDNMWMWRADHAANGSVTYSSNACDNGLIVDGNNVTMLGLAVEHTEKDLLVWNGENGSTYFYQSELPYGVTQSEYSDYAGYRVATNVKRHLGYGIGVYCFFRDHNVTVQSGIVCPSALEESFIHPLTVFLNGYGGIQHIVNDKGNASNTKYPLVHYKC